MVLRLSKNDHTLYVSFRWACQPDAFAHTEGGVQNCRHPPYSRTHMDTRRTVAGFIFPLFLLPSPAFGEGPGEAYLNVEGPFASTEEAEAACMRAVGFDEESIHLYTGNIGNLWRVENPLRFLVRRCLNTIKKGEENRITGERRVGREQERLHRELIPQSKQRIEQNDEFIRSRTRENVRTRASQHLRTAREKASSYMDVRSQRRVQIRAEERNIRDRLERRLEIEEEAKHLCENLRGTQRVMCIREHVREQEEALYGEE